MDKDMVYRQDAIDAIEHITSSMSVCVNSDECHGMKRMQRQAVIELTNLSPVQLEHNPDDERKIADLHKIVNYLLSQPERKKGKWIKGGEQPYFRKHFDIVVCSICNKRGEHRWNFCPYCGADMRGEENGKNE